MIKASSTTTAYLKFVEKPGSPSRIYNYRRRVYLRCGWWDDKTGFYTNPNEPYISTVDDQPIYVDCLNEVAVPLSVKGGGWIDALQCGYEKNLPVRGTGWKITNIYNTNQTTVDGGTKAGYIDVNEFSITQYHRNDNIKITGHLIPNYDGQTLGESGRAWGTVYTSSG
jgi:hypothetical protein